MTLITMGMRKSIKSFGRPKISRFPDDEFKLRLHFPAPNGVGHLAQKGSREGGKRKYRNDAYLVSSAPPPDSRKKPFEFTLLLGSTVGGALESGYGWPLYFPLAPFPTVLIKQAQFELLSMLRQLLFQY